MPGELQQLSRSDELLSHKNESSVFTQFVQSAAYSGAEAPIRAVAQFVDCAHYIGADAGVKTAFKAVGVEQPKPAEFGTASWYAQSLGGAVGMVAPFLALRRGITAMGEHVLGAGALSSAQTLGQMAAQEALVSGTTGLVYGSVFSPSKESNVGSWAFLGDRAKAGLGDAATFAMLGAAGPYMSKGFETLAGAAEHSAMSPLATNLISNSLRSPILSGLASGIPGGIVSAEASAMQNGRWLATPTEFKQGIAGMMFVGGAFGLASTLASKLASPSETTDAGRAVDQKGQGGEQNRQALEQNRLASDPKDQSLDSPTRSLSAQGSARESLTPGLELVDAKTIAAARHRVEAAIERGKSLDPDDLRIALTPPKEEAVKLAAAEITDSGAKSPSAFANTKDSSVAAIADKIKATDDPNLPGFEVVLGASGVEAPAHIGFLKALEEHHVKIDKITGASGGSLVAAFYANGYTTKQLSQILLSSEFRSPSFEVLAKCFHMTDPWNLFPYAIDFKPWMQEVVDKYHLEPQDNLRIVAADAQTHAPVVFEGKNIDLVEALTASTAATPALGMKPVMYQGRQLIDGFYYHPIPAALTKGPALVSKIGFVSKLPTELLSPWDYLMHLKEMNANAELSSRYPDPPGHIIAQTGLPDVATTTFGVSLETLKKLIVHAEEATNARLTEPDAVAVLSGKKPQ